MAAGDPAQAAVLLERASGLESGKASIWEALGRAHFAMRRYDVASEAFSKAIELDPSNHYAHYAMAVSLACLGLLPAAGGHIKMALAMAPDKDEYEQAWARIRMRGRQKK